MPSQGDNQRKDLRFQLKGAFNNAWFALGSRSVAAEPLDVSRHGLGVIIDDRWDYEDITALQIIFMEKSAPITLEVRFKKSEPDAGGLRARTRCGLELSEIDKRRGVDLVSLLQSTNSTLELISA